MTGANVATTQSTKKLALIAATRGSDGVDRRQTAVIRPQMPKKTAMVMIETPERSPTRWLMVSALSTPGNAATSPVRTPSVSEERPVARSTAAAGPDGRSSAGSISASTIWASRASTSSASRLRRGVVAYSVAGACCVGIERSLSVHGRGLRHQRADQTGKRGDAVRGEEEDEDDRARGAVAGESGSVVRDECGGGSREQRRRPGDVRLPDVGKSVPRARRRIGHQLGLRSACRPVPGQDDPRARQHGRPGHDRHERRAETQPLDLLSNPRRCQQVGAQAPEGGKAPGEAEKEQAADRNTVDQGPSLVVRDPHSVPPISTIE